MAEYLLSIDQGTTSSKAVLFNLQGQPVAAVSEAFTQHYPANGWVEHHASNLWGTVLRTCQQLLAEQQVSARQIKALGITNQRETTLVWHKHSGELLYPAIVWQDRRTSAYCQHLNTPALSASIQAKTGLLLDPYFSASKIRWILDKVPGAQQQAERGELAFGTVDSYLLWQFTKGKVHRTDATNASRTLLFNIHTQQWDPDLLELFAIPKSMLPEVLDCAAHFGETDASWFGHPILIGGVAGDQHAALIGQACFQPGMAKSTYGTGGFLMQNTGSTALTSDNKLLTTLAYRLQGRVTYALEGSIFMAGATLQWLVEEMQLIDHAAQSEALVQQLPYDHGVFLVPSFTGLGAPYWDANARGAILGLTRDTGRANIVAAALQAVGYQTKDLQKAMEKDGLRPTVLRVDGGMVSNNWLLAFLADILGASVERPTNSETTALGAAYLAGLHCGVFHSTAQLAELWQCQQRFTPTLSAAERQQLYAKWQHAVAQVQL